MNAKELAMLLTGREYGQEIDRTEEHQAKAAGLVVAFGASDDLLELRGAVHDEAYPSDGIGARIDAAGVVPSFESVLDDGDKAALRDYFKRENGGAVIRAVWEGEPGYSWIISTDVPHETFEIVEDGEPYCRGIVFALADLPGGARHRGDGAMQPHQQRVVDEQAELDGRIKKLGAFFGSLTFADLDEEERSRLRQQFHAMTSYSAILGERIRAFAPG